MAPHLGGEARISHTIGQFQSWAYAGVSPWLHSGTNKEQVARRYFTANANSLVQRDCNEAGTVPLLA